MSKFDSFGASLTVGMDGTTTGNYAAVGQIRNVVGPQATGTATPTPCLDDANAYVPKIGGRVDPGDVTFGIYPDAAGSTTHASLSTLLASRAIALWDVKIGASTAVERFSGIVNGYSRDIPEDGPVTAEITIAVSGNPGFST